MRELAIEAITPNLRQPRKRFDADALTGLANSLAERGMLQPVLVRELAPERFELIAGERRWRGAQLAGLQRIPAYVRASTDDAEALELALIENAARSDLTPVEEARTLSTLIDDLGLTQGVLARRIGRSRSDIANTMRLLRLPDDVVDLIDNGQLSKGHGKALLALDHDSRRSELARLATANGWSVRELERAVTADAAASRGLTLTRRPHADVAEFQARAAAIDRFAVAIKTHVDGFVVSVKAPTRVDAHGILDRLAGTLE